MTDRVVEFLVSDVGVTMSVIPPLPFLPDGVRVTPSALELYGGTKRLSFPADPALISAVEEVGGLLLLEHGTDEDAPPRELELQLL